MDGIGIHIYPQYKWGENWEEMVSAAKDDIRSVLDPVLEVSLLPVYITEGGFSRNRERSENRRLDLFHSFFKAASLLGDQYGIRQLLIFSWNQGSHSVTEDGHATSFTNKLFLDYER